MWPEAEDIFCVRHMYKDFHKLHKGEELKNSFARAKNTPTYNKTMENMKVGRVDAYKWIERWPPRTWIKSF